MELHNLDLVQIDLMLELTLGKFWSYQKSKSWVWMQKQINQFYFFPQKYQYGHP